MSWAVNAGGSTRARIMLAIGLAALPLVALVAYASIDRYRADRDRAEARATNRAELIAALVAERGAGAPSAARLQSLLTLGSTTGQTVAVVYDGTREVVRAGPRAAGPPSAEARLARRSGVFSATAPDGIARVWGLARIGKGPLTVAF